MKLCTISLLIIAQSVAADYPEDLVAQDALVILSLDNGNSINSNFESIQNQLSETGDKPDVLDVYLEQLVANPSAVDLSEKVLLAMQPTNLAPNQKPTGMFGPMPHLVLICKPIVGSKIEINSSLLKTSGMFEGWFVASGSDNLSIPNNEKLSPLFAQLPAGQLSVAVHFEKIWKQFGPISQMMGGMMINSMNKPGPTGVIDPETKRQSAAARNAFGKAVAFCSKVQLLTYGSSISDNKLTSEVSMKTLDSQDISIDNTNLENMSSVLAGDTIQYGMSGWFTRMLLDYELDSLASMGEISESLPMMIITKSMQDLAKIQEENVVSYSLNGKTGVSVSALAVTSNQSEYMAMVPLVINEAALQLKDNFYIQLLQNYASSNTWSIKMLGQDEEDIKVMESVFPNDVQLNVGVQGSDRIFWSVGPKSFRPFIQPHLSPLSQLLKNNEDLAVDLAFVTDARKFASGFIDIAISAGSITAEDAIPSAPSADASFILGRNSSGWAATYEIDLLGFAKLVNDLDDLN